MELLLKRLIIFSVVPAILLGQVSIGFISINAQNMTPGGMMGGNMTPGGMMGGNMTPGGMMGGNMTPGGMMGGSPKMHLEEAIKALESGNIQLANMHLNIAKQAMANAPGDAVKHFEEGMKALVAGDSNGALMHLKLAEQALG
jgi:cellobiose-specific phosphotransferase system component IIA